MHRGRTLSLGLPPFTKAVKWLIILNCGIFLLQAFLGAVAPQIAAWAAIFELRPALVLHGWVWQLVSYAFLHSGVGHLLFNMLAIWMFGSQFELDWGRRQFLEFYFFCVVGAALCTIAVSFTGLGGITPLTATVGSSGGIFGLLMAFGLRYGDREIMLFPLPFLIKAKYFVAGLAFISLVGALQGAAGQGQAIAYIAHLGGLVFGWVYIRFLPRRGLSALFSERWFGLRNTYYRWKRRRAARKFEVYMRKHDRSQFFDEYGNYRDPNDPNAPKDKGDGESKWVN